MLARRGFWLLLSALLAVPDASSARRRPQHGNPHEEITATARVESSPRRTRHRNGRSFEELDVLLLSVRAADPRGESGIEFDTRSPVHVIHDLTCGGTWVDLAPGDRVSLKGEYVHPPSGGDLVHFTHPADPSCGRGIHPGGFLRREAGARAEVPSREATPGVNPSAGADGPAIDSSSLSAFRTSVRPILAARCAPCHEPGGRMYERMPFDNASVVATHAPRMGGRLKGADRRALEDWAAGIPSTSGR
ncbi:MAG: hypothetical protein ABJC07_02635 [Acidobacteriota bacterium]